MPPIDFVLIGSPLSLREHCTSSVRRTNADFASQNRAAASSKNALSNIGMRIVSTDETASAPNATLSNASPAIRSSVAVRGTADIPPPHKVRRSRSLLDFREVSTGSKAPPSESSTRMRRPTRRRPSLPNAGPRGKRTVRRASSASTQSARLGARARQTGAAHAEPATVATATSSRRAWSGIGNATSPSPSTPSPSTPSPQRRKSATSTTSSPTAPLTPTTPVDTEELRLRALQRVKDSRARHARRLNTAENAELLARAAKVREREAARLAKDLRRRRIYARNAVMRYWEMEKMAAYDAFRAGQVPGAEAKSSEGNELATALFRGEDELLLGESEVAVEATSQAVEPMRPTIVAEARAATFLKV